MCTDMAVIKDIRKQVLLKYAVFCLISEEIFSFLHIVIRRTFVCMTAFIGCVPIFTGGILKIYASYYVYYRSPALSVNISERGHCFHDEYRTSTRSFLRSMNLEECIFPSCGGKGSPARAFKRFVLLALIGIYYRAETSYCTRNRYHDGKSLL